jgi:hypothetical protein
MFIEKELLIVSAKPDSLDMQPRGQPCDAINVEAHMFVLKFATAGFMYRICGRCGTVRISEPQVTHETI